MKSLKNRREVVMNIDTESVAKSIELKHYGNPPTESAIMREFIRVALSLLFPLI